MSFRLNSLLRLLFIALLVPGLAGAGIPEERTVRCPFGGESVRFTVSSSCTIYQEERYMSFAPRTSCEFVEQLPQCKKSKLPLYREFTADEIKFLRQFSKSDEYKAAASLSRFYLAQVIESKLRPDNSELQFELLLGGYWDDSARTFGNAEYFAAFAAAANKRLAVGEGQEKVFVMAVSAYAALMMGKTNKARELIRAVKSATDAKGTMMLPYIRAVETCLKKRSDPSCQPDHPITLVE